MIEETRIVCHCEYCKKYLLRKSAMLLHEKECRKNPDVKIICFGCAFRKSLKEEFDYDVPFKEKADRQHHISFEFQYCIKRNIKMIPPKAFANEFLSGALKDKYDQIMPTVSIGCLDYKNSDRVSLSIEDYDKAINLYPNHPHLLYLRGDAKMTIGDYVGAIEDFKKAIDIGINKEYVYDWCIYAYECLNDFESARKMKEQRNTIFKPYWIYK